jgi:small subunit ribosomal protein S5
MATFKKNKPGGKKYSRPEQEFEQKLVDLARVTRVMAGGKRMRFRACVVLGDRKGRVGYGVAKGTDVQIAIGKAVDQAKKRIIKIDSEKGTVPHQVNVKYGAAKVLLKPAPKGSGVIAGGAVRIVLQLAGIQNVVSKMLGSANKISNVKATFLALKVMRWDEKPKKT